MFVCVYIFIPKTLLELLLLFFTPRDHLELPFAKWSTGMVLSWLDDLGLGQYTEACQRTISCGDDLLRASGLELERDLGIGDPLHRKKLQLALQVCMHFV